MEHELPSKNGMECNVEWIKTKRRRLEAPERVRFYPTTKIISIHPAERAPRLLNSQDHSRRIKNVILDRNVSDHIYFYIRRENILSPLYNDDVAFIKSGTESHV